MKKALIIIALLYGLLFSRYYQQDFLPSEFDSLEALVCQKELLHNFS
jgi:hypothetical protein